MQIATGIIYSEFLQQVKEGVLDAFENQEFQFDSMLSLVDRDEKMEGRPIVQVHFSFANFLEEGSGLNRLGFMPLPVRGHETTQFEWKVEVTEKDHRFIIAFIYSTELYDPTFIGVLAEYYDNILRAVLKDPSVEIDGIALENSFNLV